MLAVLPIAVSMFVVILAQSAATARAYADRFDEQVDTDADLVALGGANLAAAATGTFVVNGSPTKTQMVVGAGGRSQLAQLAAVGVVLVICLVATGLLGALPLAALAAVVFLIGVELIDVAGLRRILARAPRGVRGRAAHRGRGGAARGASRASWWPIAVSIIDHLRHSYEPRSTVLVKSPAGHWRSLPVTPGARTAPGLLVYRFGSGLYFANASRLAADVSTLTGGGHRCAGSAWTRRRSGTWTTRPPRCSAGSSTGCTRRDAGGAVRRERRGARRAGPLRAGARLGPDTSTTPPARCSRTSSPSPTHHAVEVRRTDHG